MRPSFAAPLSLLLAAAMFWPAAGCTTASQDIDEFISSFVPPSPSQAARDMLNPDDADRRRRGLVLISTSYFGGEEAYVRTYRNYAQSDQDPTVRAAAVEALGRHGEPDDATIIADQLGHENVQVRWAAARALQRLHNPAVIGQVGRRLRDEEEHVDVRIAAAIALGQYRSSLAFESLVAALETRHLAVNLMAKRSLQIMTGQDIGMNSDAWIDWERSVDDPFAQGRAYLYPTYSRDETLLEKFAFWSTPEFEKPAPPRGAPYADRVEHSEADAASVDDLD